MNLGKTSRWLGMLLSLVAAAMFLPTIAHAQAQRVEVQMSTNRVSVDESVILSVRAYGMDAAIDTSALDVDFDVTKRSSSRQDTIENGQRTTLVEWVLELMPKRMGALEIPPIIVGTERSRPLTLLVEKLPDGSDRDLYLEASVDVTDPFVQAQVIYTLRVFKDVRLLDASLTVPEVDEVVMQQLSEEINYNETVDGREYAVSEIRYSIFPQKSGQMTTPSLALQAVVPVDKQPIPNTRIRTRRITRRANEVVLNVRPRPDDFAGRWWLPAKDVQLQSEWSSSIESLVVDQPVTRTIYLMATGLGDAQLPELDVPVIDKISVYADSPTAATNASERGLISQQTNIWAVIPQEAGELTLPEVRINWFDTTTGEARVAVLPEETLIVATAEGVAQPSNPASGQTQNGVAANQAVDAAGADDTDALLENTLQESIQSDVTAPQGPLNNIDEMSNVSAVQMLQSMHRWRAIAVSLLVGWMLSLLGFWLWWKKIGTERISQAHDTKNRTLKDPQRFIRQAGSRAALAPIKAACESADASKISKSVLAWAATMWPVNTPTNLSVVAERLKSPALSAVFDAIDAELYRPANSVKPLAVESVPELIRSAVEQYQVTEPSGVKSNALPSL